MARGSLAMTEGRHVRGASLAVKLAGAITVMVALFMIGFALVVGAFLKRSVADQLEITAFEAARTAAQMDVEAWSQWFGTPYQGLSPEQIQAEIDRIPPQLRDQRFLSPEQKEQREWNRSRLARFADAHSTLLAIQRLSADGAAMLDGTYVGENTHYYAYRDRREPMGAGFVEQGRLTIEGREYEVVRGDYPIVDRHGEITGRFSAFIDARAIDELSTQLLFVVGYIAVGFVLVGAGLSFFLGRRITKPLAQLQQDIRIVAGGDLEHHTVPRSSDEIGELARSFNAMTKNLAEAREHERAAARSQHEVSVAAEVAQSLLPATLPRVPGFELGAHHETSAALGGESYDVLAMDGGRYGLVVASASGEGVPAAMVMAMARSTLAAVARHEREPDVILRAVNALVSSRLRRGMYISVLLAVLDPVRATLRAANAGADPLLVYTAADGMLAPIHSEGIALGFDEGPVFDATLKSFDLVLAPGDRVVLAGRGLPRVEGADGQPLGGKRLAALVRREAARPTEVFVKRVAATLAKFRGGREASADVTLLTLGRPAGGSASTA